MIVIYTAIFSMVLTGLIVFGIRRESIGKISLPSKFLGCVATWFGCWKLILSISNVEYRPELFKGILLMLIGVLLLLVAKLYDHVNSK